MRAFKLGLGVSSLLTGFFSRIGQREPEWQDNWQDQDVGHSLSKGVGPGHV